MTAMPLPVNRRSFLTATGAATLTAASYDRVHGANERIGVGFIGYGLIGKRHALDFQAEPDVAPIAIAETHSGRLAEARKQLGESTRGYADFRKLIDDKDVQAVVVSTPDHWRALMTMLACAAGKDVYVEKPLSLFVREGRWMVDVAVRNKRVVQVGTQQRSGKHYQRARDLIRAGHIGKVVTVKMHAYRNIMPGFGSPPDGDPPAELDWDMLLGPAPLRKYNPNRGIYHFRWFWDYSGGQMTNLGHHALDIVRWVLGGDPTAVTSSGGRFALADNGETPDTQDALFEFTGTGGGWTAHWSHRETSGWLVRPMSIEFYGTKGVLGIDRKGFTIKPDKKVPPESRIPVFGGTPVGGPKTKEPGPDEFWTTAIEDTTGSESEQFKGHVRNFLNCVKSRAAPSSDLESSHRVSTMCHLANLSLRLGRKLRWNAAEETTIGDKEAAALLVRGYRPPWDRELQALKVT
jgi:predicted dehydrogenase